MVAYTSRRCRRPTYRRKKRYSKYINKYSDRSNTKQSKRSGTNGRVMMFKTPPLLGKSFRTTLRYCDNLRLLPSVTAGNYNPFFLSANSLYDPNTSGTGHQPTGFDTIMQLYKYYTVIGSKITVTANNTDDNWPCRFAIDCTNSTSQLSNDFRTIQESGTIKWVTLSSEKGSKAACTLSYGSSPKKFLGISHPMSEDKLKADVSSNPATQFYYMLAASGVNNGGQQEELLIDYTIEYTVVFTSPNDLLLS